MNENFIKNYEYYKDVSLKKYNTYRVEATCKYLIFPHSEQELINLLKVLKKENCSYLILGNGSNVILQRKVFFIIIKLDKLDKLEITDNIVRVGAGVSLIKLANACMENSLNGLSFAGGIPGNVGASVAMNAGAYKEEMADIIREVKVLTPSLEVVTMTNDELDFAYRHSFLKENKDYVCLEATLELKYGDKEEIKKVMDNRRERRVNTQPLDMPSAGSVFRNPPDVPAGKLIEDLGLKGYCIGGAKISEKHANFIVNTGDATADDIVNLIDYVSNEVQKQYGIKLILEQEIIR